MVKGFKATLFAGVISLGAFAPAYAAAPVISGLPDIQIGDMEDSGSTDSNLFVFSDAFSFSDYVTDADTPDNQLKWSFGEFTNLNMSTGQDNQYSINGVEAVLQGDAAIAADALTGYATVKTGAGQINASSDLATFRDIVFSPTSGSAPYPDPSPADAAAAANGKALRFFVTDPELNLGYQDVMIETVDDEFDKLTATDGYQEVVRDEALTPGWELSGIQSAEVTISAAPGQLNINVQPASGKYRILGWVNKNVYPYNSVGATKFLRGKFYVTTSNAPSAPINEVPNFRLRVTNEGVVAGAAHFEYAQTGFTDPGYEPLYGQLNNPAIETYSTSLRPSSVAGTPSLYKVDFDPIDVPAAENSNIGALIESYTAQDPANATLSLLEFALATYDAKTDAEGTLIWEYTKAADVEVGGAKSVNGGFFNHEADFQPGRRQNLYLPGTDPGPYGTAGDTGAGGLVADTDAVQTDVFGIALVNIESTNDADKLRIAPGQLYRAKFYATSPVPTASVDPAVEIQGNMRFRFQTVANSVSYLLDMATLAGFSNGPAADAISVEALPGVGSENPETDAALDVAGEDGGWYSVIVPSPLDVDAIREDLADNFGALATEPGPGVNAASAKNVVLGADLIQIPANLTIAPGTSVPFGRPNRAMIRISAIEVYSYPSVDDGGYDF